MIRAAAFLRAAALAVPLAGCAGDDLSFYKRPLDGAAEAEAQAKPDADAPAPFPYQVADLQPQYRPAPASTEAGLWLMVDKIERRIRTAGHRVRDPGLNAYIETVACRVAEDYCRDVRPYLLNVANFNAGMYPNGLMQLHTGLLLRVRNEAQLAAVIGHETGHYLRRHSLQRMKDVIEKSNALMFFSFATAMAGVGFVGDIAQLMALAEISAFGRNHEREADGYGLLLMARAGYDPNEAWKVWDNIIKERNAIKDYSAPSLFTATHPYSEERMKVLKKLAKSVPGAEKATDKGRERFLAAVLPHRARFLRAELAQRQFDAFAVLLDMLQEDGANPAEVHYFRGELYRLRAKKDDAPKALESYRAALAAEGTAPADIQRAIGLVHRRLGANEQARAAFKAYLEANPGASDAAIIRHLIGADDT